MSEGHTAVAVADALDRHSDLLEHCHEQVRYRCVFWDNHMTSTSDLTASRQHEWQIVVQMYVAVADACTVQNEGVVEERTVAIGRRPKLIEEVRELLHVKGIDLRQLRRLIWFVR